MSGRDSQAAEERAQGRCDVGAALRAFGVIGRSISTPSVETPPELDIEALHLSESEGAVERFARKRGHQHKVLEALAARSSLARLENRPTDAWAEFETLGEDGATVLVADPTARHADRAGLLIGSRTLRAVPTGH